MHTLTFFSAGVFRAEWHQETRTDQYALRGLLDGHRHSLQRAHVLDPDY